MSRAVSLLFQFILTPVLCGLFGYAVVEVAISFYNEQSLWNTFYLVSAPIGSLLVVSFIATFFQYPVGLWRPLELRADEAVVWQESASHQQSRRSVGGKLYLTNQRMAFKVIKIDRLFLGKDWSVDRATLSDVSIIDGDIKSAPFAGSVRRRLQVTLADGSTQRFVVNGLDQAMTRLHGQLG